MSDYDIALQKHLRKCELDYHISHANCAVEVSWLAGFCDSVQSISAYLRSIGYKIKRIVDEEPWPGEVHQWVETTNGLIVYVNSNGLIAKAAKV